MAKKSNRATTGVDEFYFAVLSSDDEASFTAEGITRIPFLQEITVDMPQTVERAYGDNRTAELAVSNGNLTITTKFHAVPTESKAVLFGLETTVEGLSAYGAEDTPPYVAAVFARTYQDGAKEWVGLTKGMFLRPGMNAETKGEGVTFSSDEVTGEFMERFVEGYKTEKSILTGRDEAEEVTARDTMFMKVFGSEYPVGAIAGA